MADDLTIIIRAKTAEAVEALRKVGIEAVKTGQKAAQSSAGFDRMEKASRHLTAAQRVLANTFRTNRTRLTASLRSWSRFKVELSQIGTTARSTGKAILLAGEYARRAAGQIIAAAGGLAAVGGKIRSAGQSLRGFGLGASLYITAPIVAMGTASIKAFASFDEAMTQSLAIMGDVSDEMKSKMADLARTLSKQSTFSAKELAEAYFFLASAGLDAAQSLEALPSVTRFAQAGMFDLSRATSLLAGSQTALGLRSADAAENMKNLLQISDVLVKANRLADATTEQFALALARAGGTMKAFGVPLEEGVAVLGQYANVQLKAEVGGEALARMLRLMIPAARENAEAYAALGINVFNAEGNLRSISDILYDMEDSLDHLSTSEKSAALEALGFQRRMQGVILPLIGSSDAIRTYQGALQKAGGTAQDVANKQLEAVNSKLDIMKNRVNVAAQNLGRIFTPEFLKVAERVVGVVERQVAKFDALSEAEKKSAMKAAALLAVLGPASIALGTLIIVAGNAVTAIAGLGKALLFFHGIAIGTTTALGILLNATAVLATAFAGFMVGMKLYESNFLGLGTAADWLAQKLVAVAGATKMVEEAQRNVTAAEAKTLRMARERGAIAIRTANDTIVATKNIETAIQRIEEGGKVVVATAEQRAAITKQRLADIAVGVAEDTVGTMSDAAATVEIKVSADTTAAEEAIGRLGAGIAVDAVGGKRSAVTDKAQLSALGINDALIEELTRGLPKGAETDTGAPIGGVEPMARPGDTAAGGALSPEALGAGTTINVNGPVNAYGARNMQEVLQRSPQVAIAGPGGA